MNKFIVFGKRDLIDYPVSECVDYYNRTRSSMVRDHLPPIRKEPDEVESFELEPRVDNEAPEGAMAATLTNSLSAGCCVHHVTGHLRLATCSAK